MKEKLQFLITQQAKESGQKLIIPFIINPIKRATHFNLTLKERSILWLRMGGFTNYEIARLLQRSESNITSTLHRIKQKLRIEKDYKIPYKNYASSFFFRKVFVTKLAPFF